MLFLSVYLHLIMGLSDTCHDVLEFFYKGLNLHWERNSIISQVDTEDSVIVERAMMLPGSCTASWQLGNTHLSI